MIANMLSLYMVINSNKKFNIIFYEDDTGYSQIYDFLEKLRAKSKTDKDARIQYRQIVLYIDLLSKNGLNLSTEIIKHIEGNIWEMRPGKNRILYFYFRDNTFVLLHQFIKKTQKTPTREINQAKNEIKNFLRKEGNKWKHGILIKSK